MAFAAFAANLLYGSEARSILPTTERFGPFRRIVSLSYAIRHGLNQGSN